MSRAVFRLSLLLILGACAVDLPAPRQPVYGGSVETIPADAPVVIGNSLPNETSFSIENSTRVFPRGGSTRPTATFDMAIAGEQRIDQTPGGYDVLATITESRITSDRRLDAESEQNMADIADGLRALEIRLQLDQDRRLVPGSLQIVGNPLSTNENGSAEQLPDAVLELLDSLATQAARQPDLELATGDAIVSVSIELPDGNAVSVFEVVDGRVTHKGRDAVLLHIEADVPPDFPLAVSGYSVIDLATGLVLESQHSMASVVQGIGTEDLTSTSHSISAAD